MDHYLIGNYVAVGQSFDGKFEGCLTWDGSLVAIQEVLESKAPVHGVVFSNDLPTTAAIAVRMSGDVTIHSVGERSGKLVCKPVLYIGTKKPEKDLVADERLQKIRTMAMKISEIAGKGLDA